MPNTHSTLASLFSDIADAIRSKKGTSADIVADNFPTEIASIPTGGGTDYLQYATTCPEFSNRIPDENVVLNMPICAKFSGTFSTNSSTVPKQKTITVNSSASVTAVDRMFDYYNRQQHPLERITLNFNTASCTSFDRMIGSAPNLQTIDGTPIDFSSVAASATAGNNRIFNNLYNTRALSVSFVPNTLKGSVMMSDAFLSDASMVSVANCLTATAKTIQLNETMKTRCQAIMGTVSQMTEDGVTYDFFTADASGTVTLENFITQTKGWTIA